MPYDTPTPSPGTHDARPVAAEGAPAEPAGRVKAYEDLEFLHSADARVVRVLAELLEPQSRLERHGVTDTIVFFGSARIRGPEQDGAGAAAEGLTPYYDDARALARRLTAWSRARAGQRRFVVASGGGPGIMEAANRGAAEAGGPTVGMGISLPLEPANNAYLPPELAFEFRYYFMRKLHLFTTAKAAVFFPGGFGTIDEMMELLTLLQTRMMRKRMGVVLYGRPFWESVIDFEAMVRHGVISPQDRDLFHFADDVETAFASIRDFLEAHYGGEPGVAAVD